jgi:hypothetical protein
MSAADELPSSSSSGLALSVLYVQEISVLLSKIRNMVIAAFGASVILLLTPLLVLTGFREASEEVLSLEGEFLGGIILVLLIVPTAAYLALRSMSAMGKWRDRLDGLAFALRFETRLALGESPSSRLANQALAGLNRAPGEVETGIDPGNFINSNFDGSTYDVVIPNDVVRTLSGHRGALLGRRYEGKSVTPRDLEESIDRVRSGHERPWRLLIVSDREFPSETLSYHSTVMGKTGFAVDLVEETSLGFSVVALGA